MNSVGTIKYLFHDGVQGRAAAGDQVTPEDAPVSSPLQPPPSSHDKSSSHGKRYREDAPTPPSLKAVKRQFRKLTAEQAMGTMGAACGARP